MQCNSEQPKWSFHKRTLPTNLTPLSSKEGKAYFLHSLATSHAESFIPLSEQFLTQSEPAYCGLSTLAMVLNSLSVDPNVIWKGGWRWFDEDMLLKGCCVDKRVVEKKGIVMEQFASLGRCNGAKMSMKRPDRCSENNFRNDVINVVSDGTQNAFLISSYSRSALQQTGDGHFSPIAAYHAPTDQVLILDVARFKYAPYWVPLKELYHAMRMVDDDTGKSRGWFVVSPELRTEEHSEKRRPGELVHFDKCPVGPIKMTYCKARRHIR